MVIGGLLSTPRKFFVWIFLEYGMVSGLGQRGATHKTWGLVVRGGVEEKRQG